MNCKCCVGALQDRRLEPLLEMLRSSGRKLFLATNSLWDYTHVIMNYLISNRVGTDRNEDWLEYFDVIITGAFSLIEALQSSGKCYLT